MWRHTLIKSLKEDVFFFFFNVHECLFVHMYSYLLLHVRRGQKRELIPQIGKLIKKEGHYDCVLETKIKEYIWRWLSQ